MRKTMCRHGIAQVPFSLDTTFRTDMVDQYVNSIAALADGKLLLSGRIRFPVDVPWGSSRGSARLLPDGQRDVSFTGFTGNGRLTPWAGKFYVGVGQTVRRLTDEGDVDPTFIVMNSGPYFSSLQGGDYHVFPDGRLLVSGAHTLSDTERGFVGLYQLIWFTNTGYLDTTRIHRKGNGTVFDFVELPDGKFICSGYCSQFDGLPCDGIFRVHADGALDTTFHTGVNSGRAFGFLPMADGRVYTCGIFTRTQAPVDTLRMVRFMPDGELDPTFTSPLFSLGDLTNLGGIGPGANNLQRWPNGRVVVTGNFQLVNGQPRRGICVLEADGALSDLFDDCGVDPFTYMGVTTGAVGGILPDADSTHYYIWGQYTGYDDGTTNDTLQRFVTRLHAGDITTGTSSATKEPRFALYPNPTSGSVTVAIGELYKEAMIMVRDALGREVLRQRVRDHYTTLTLDGSGVYMVELWDSHGRVATQRVVVE